MTNPTSASPQAMPPPASSPSWFAKNWYWLVGGGCLVPILCCGFFGTLAAIFANKAKNAEAVLESLVRANANAEVTARLGRPVTPSGFPSLDLKDENGQESASGSVDVEGPNGKGILTIAAEKHLGNWVFSVQEIQIDGDTIQLLEGDIGTNPNDDVDAAPDDEMNAPNDAAEDDEGVDEEAPPIEPKKPVAKPKPSTPPGNPKRR